MLKVRPQDLNQICEALIKPMTNWQHGASSRKQTPAVLVTCLVPLTFLLGAVYDVLPGPAHLFTRDEPEEHWSRCWAASQQDSARADIPGAITRCWNLFPKPSAGILATSQNWQLSVDREKQLSFLRHIVSTTLRQDIFPVSENAKNIIMMELTSGHKLSRAGLEGEVGFWRSIFYIFQCTACFWWCDLVTHLIHTRTLTPSSRCSSLRAVTSSSFRMSALVLFFWLYFS